MPENRKMNGKIIQQKTNATLEIVFMCHLHLLHRKFRNFTVCAVAPFCAANMIPQLIFYSNEYKIGHIKFLFLLYNQKELPRRTMKVNSENKITTATTAATTKKNIELSEPQSTKQRREKKRINERHYGFFSFHSFYC